MTDSERIIAMLRGIDARLARIERAVAPPVYKVADDGVLTRIAAPSQITEGTTTAGPIWNQRVIPIRRITGEPVCMGIPEGEGLL